MQSSFDATVADEVHVVHRHRNYVVAAHRTVDDHASTLDVMAPDLAHILVVLVAAVALHKLYVMFMFLIRRQ
jgi:hypothetical protein